MKTLLARGAAALMMVLPGLAAQDAHAARVTVPVDRSNPASGSLSLYVERVPATGKRRQSLLYIAGGPGSAATTEAADVVASLGPDVRRSTEVITFDARGTGRSGVFRCDALQQDRSLRSTSAATACATSLGARRGITTPDEQVADIEAVRVALKIPKLTLLGVSYGTEIAQRYAQRYPTRVRRMVLDSVLPPEGPSALGLEVFSGMQRVLGTYCARRRCAEGVPNPATTLSGLVASLRAQPLTANVYDGRGRARARTLDPVALLDVLLAGDFSPALRLALPSAIAAAQAGNAAPLLRLKELDDGATPLPKLASFSVGQYAATSCESLALPWDGAADPATRRAQATARLAALGPAAFAPFDAQTVLDGDFLPLCIGWPAQVRPPVAPPREMPAVPALYIAGEEDLRTPLESARDAASRNAAGRLLRVAGVGHSVLTTDDTGCAARAASRFLRGASSYRPPTRCAGPSAYVPPVPLTPTATDVRFGATKTINQRVRRTLAVINGTLDDLIVAVSAGGTTGGGLYGGSYRVRGGGIATTDYQFVPGVRVSITPLRNRGARIAIRGNGVLTGTITLRRNGKVTGRLDGKPITGELPAGPPSV